MLAAHLYGKSGAEDLLTGAVFGTLAILPARVGIAPWLRKAQPFAGEAAPGIEIGEDYQLRFWPSFAYGGGWVVPDLIIESPGQLLIVEAKYGAGPSGAPGNAPIIEGQLGRQWAAVHASNSGADRVALIYLTADWSMPTDILEPMCEEVERKQFPKPLREHLYWLSWRTLEGVLPSEFRELSLPAARGVAMLSAFLRSRGLQTFRPACCSVSVPLRWSYRRLGVPRIRRYVTHLPPTRLNWSYRT